MIEGQEGVSWEHWLALARACEESGIESLFRSDHYQSVFQDPTRVALDAWATISALAAVTERLRLGTLVSPVTFRRAGELAKVVATADHVSGGRVELGLGAGWNEREHEAFGFPFPDLGERMDELEQQLEHVRRQWAELSPRPVQQPGPPLIVGGTAGTAQLPPRRAPCRRVQHRVRLGRGLRRAEGTGRRRVPRRWSRADPVLSDDRLRRGPRPQRRSSGAAVRSRSEQASSSTTSSGAPGRSRARSTRWSRGSASTPGSASGASTSSISSMRTSRWWSWSARRSCRPWPPDRVAVVRRALLLLIPLAAIGFALAGCGGSKESASTTTRAAGFSTVEATRPSR